MTDFLKVLACISIALMTISGRGWKQVQLAQRGMAFIAITKSSRSANNSMSSETRALFCVGLKTGAQSLLHHDEAFIYRYPSVTTNQMVKCRTIFQVCHSPQESSKVGILKTVKPHGLATKAM
ncbi:hypothetical protein PanWU01x14_292090 [Parasponia andersonii]|uniref:Secreted protein n=1 Tax=Parasponia andersonii TaxID=3476 RepID=A0A2P5AX81_PARAD|nr:hypothetical protein PanWU01x14_292090 [Parasponia andersonii]